ncbi:hypothetical protein EJ08DRAFT_702714 [Tothia fuscella]|uniref:Uncharacterized protein n=1 Tax=Tothia fuscella TaxID=1048955 RepID=A0A9P4TSB5_9PEZI|nr:hypothetical protein EJ08DRAFT_702714 [Tothia fuscella]
MVSGETQALKPSFGSKLSNFLFVKKKPPGIGGTKFLSPANMLDSKRGKPTHQNSSTPPHSDISLVESEPGEVAREPESIVTVPLSSAVHYFCDNCKNLTREGRNVRLRPTLAQLERSKAGGCVNCTWILDAIMVLEPQWKAAGQKLDMKDIHASWSEGFDVGAIDLNYQFSQLVQLELHTWPNEHPLMQEFPCHKPLDQNSALLSLSAPRKA